MDPCSFSNSDVFVTKSIHFDWSIDFEQKQITGAVSLTCALLKDSPSEFILDTRALSIQSVTVGGEKCEFKYGSRGKKCEALGLPLHVLLPTSVPAAGSEVVMTINYSTTDNCSALQWLTKEQTCGGKHPYLFSQCQVTAIWLVSQTVC